MTTGQITCYKSGQFKNSQHLLPGELARPLRQVEHVGLGQLVLAGAPRHFLHLDPATHALDPPHAVQQDDSEAPDRDELEAPLGQMVVTAGRCLAPRAASLRALPGFDIDLDGMGARIQPGPGVNEAGEMMAGVEQTGQQHGRQEHPRESGSQYEHCTSGPGGVLPVPRTVAGALARGGCCAIWRRAAARASSCIEYKLLVKDE